MVFKTTAGTTMPVRVRQLVPVLMGVAMATVAAAPALAQGADRPNVLVLMVDDLDTMSWNRALAMGLLPHIQQHLIDKGTTFPDSFATQPSCCPSRATYLTGQYPHNHRVVRNTKPSGGRSVFNETSTLATWMQGGGYRTGLIGKYLNGYDKPREVPAGWETWNALYDGGNAYCMYGYKLSINGTVVSYGGAEADYKTDVFAGLADTFLRVDDPRPFFLTLTPNAPHYELCLGTQNVRPAPRHAGTLDEPFPESVMFAFNEADMSDKPGWMRSRPLVDQETWRVFHNEVIMSLRAVDDMVGRLVATLTERNQLDRTLIVFASDNGLQYGTHRLTDKGSLYEESVRVPLVVRAPGQTTPSVAPEWALNVDLAPTVVDYAGVTPGLVQDGRSLRPVLEAQPDRVWRQSVLLEKPVAPEDLTEVGRPYRALRTRASALTRDSTGQSVYVFAETLDRVTGAPTANEYYDMQVDPWQLTSRHAATDSTSKQRMRSMRDRVRQLATCVGETCRTLEN